MSDSTIIETNSDATGAKRYAVDRGYWSDPFIRYFSSRLDKGRRTVILSRRYFTRVHTFFTQAVAFCSKFQGKCNIVSLGAGFDTLYWRLKANGTTFSQFVEVDFKEVILHKAEIVKRHRPLHDLQGDDYTAMSHDLRAEDAAASIRAAVTDPSLPTLIMTECVLVYMPPNDSHRLIAAMAEAFPTSIWLDYEPINATDSFGQMMVHNLKARGCELPGIHASPTVAAHSRRFEDSGYEHATAVDLNHAYQLIPADERRRIQRLEFLDELEEWTLINSHYCCTTACVDAANAGLQHLLLPTQP
ncbi:hypothetical protein PTSG_02743 [Salpingoeca rosetta]|uniref:Leucine carboxyl methyltransferase 1 n=1 Tax=Salpingoeca rosetta (strain ATCC 50818 / BSB-021) TaxID=946362 RepID=F2U368_SALR5|nr:uncharacterized protein PTSG_02743 [Salpingoeca rosetta]EGD82062.1 hypothetical protein PTSG_02743 [Salpingoeca rosetta]|eukprot:XP_004996245.1 hypothetical protein PTSG_02743 [Salpingoeca rosetta]